MKQSDRIKRNTLFALLSQGLRLITTAFAFILIARSYGPMEFGQFATAHTLSTIFVLLADFGFDMLVSSEVARQRERASQLIHTYLPMKLMFAGIASVAMLVFGLFAEVSDSTRLLIYVFSFYVLITSLTSFFFSLFKSFEELHHETKISVVMNILLLAALATMYIVHMSIFAVAIVFVGSRIIGLILALNIATSKISFKGFRFAYPSKVLVRQIGVFGFYSIFTNLYFIQDTVLLSLWRGDLDAGVYQSVIKIVALALTLADIASLTLLPVFARLYAEDTDRWLSFGKLLQKTLLFLGIPLSLALIVCAQTIIHLLYGLRSYQESVPILQLFGVVIFIRYFAETSAIMLTTSLHQIPRLVIVVAATVMNFTLNAIAIPQYGPYGAGIVSLITSVFVAAGLLLAARRHMSEWILQIRSVVLIIIGAGVGFLSWKYDFLSSLYASIPVIGGIIIFGYFYLYSKEERAHLFSLNRVSLVPG